MKPEEVQLTTLQHIKVFFKTINSFMPQLKYLTIFLIGTYIAYSYIFEPHRGGIPYTIIELALSAFIGAISSFVICFVIPEILWDETIKPGWRHFKEDWTTRYETRKLVEQEASLKKVDEIILKK